MLRGIDPSSHGLEDNANTPFVCDTPSFLGMARSARLRTAAITSWVQIDSLIEPEACAERVALDSGYDPSDDDRVADHVAVMYRHDPPDVAFAYLIAPDLAGHDHGWGSDQYLATLSSVDAVLGRILGSVGSDVSILVTTDHGGVGTNHGDATRDVLEVFVAGRAPSIAPGSWWPAASTLDVAPTAAALAGLDAHDGWQGSSLLGSERPAVDMLLDLVASTESFSYGEDVTMLEHALQAAAVARSADLDDDLVVAALLHDLGHPIGDAGTYGDPDHAAIAARFLGPWLPETIVEPIRLHVEAKRRMVVADPGYLAALSEASVITLEQQGGPLTVDECNDFDANPHASRAVELRRADDEAKLADPAAAGLTVAPLESYRELIAASLAAGPIDPAQARDSCCCELCRDATSGQRLITAADRTGWQVLGQRITSESKVVDLVRGTEQHRCEIRKPEHPAETAPISHWNADFDLGGRRRDANDVDSVSNDVVTMGVSLVDGLGTAPGTVLDFARSLGFVRETNYGDLFDVLSEPAPTNLAYSPLALPLHTDNPYRDPTPTVQILHCLVPAAEGGATRLADAWSAADELSKVYPEAYSLLASTPVEFRFDGDDGVDLRATRPIFDVGPDGALRSVALNNRSLHTPLSAAMAEAVLAFTELLEQGAIELMLQAGEALIFDNRRVLHARRGFDASEGRHLQGCYIDIDALRSRSLAGP